MEKTDDVIKLPDIDHDDPYPLVKAIQVRRSVRDFSGEALDANELSLILWSCQGITEDRRALRAAPSAGAIYPFTLYTVTQKGTHRYDPTEHTLTLHKEGDLREALTRVALDQKAILNAGAVLVFVYDQKRLESRYRDRAFRYACIEAGHIAQNALLAVEALGLKAVAIGAYHDRFVMDLLELEDEPLYMVAVGRS